MLLAFPQHICRQMGEAGDDYEQDDGDDDGDDDGGDDGDDGEVRRRTLMMIFLKNFVEKRVRSWSLS